MTDPEGNEFRAKRPPEERSDIGLAQRHATTSASESSYEVRHEAQRSAGT